jgi:hypothetical protein
MISNKLRAFIERVTAAKRITSDDVRYLYRDVLDGGIPSRAVADALLTLDRGLETDPSWADFLVPHVVDFAVWGMRPTGVIDAETATWLVTALGAGDPTPAAVRILQEIAAEAHEIDPVLLLQVWQSTGRKARIAA